MDLSGRLECLKGSFRSLPVLSSLLPDFHRLRSCAAGSCSLGARTVTKAGTRLSCILNCAGGDGPMAGLLRAMVVREGLQERVRMLGAVPTERVRDVLARPAHRIFPEDVSTFR